MAAPTLRISVLDATQCTCPNEHPHLDEFVIHGEMSFHFEAMGVAQFWMAITLPDGRSWDINCGAVNTQARGYCRVEADA